MEEERVRARTSAHVRAASHGRGGGHPTTLRRFQTKAGHKTLMTPGLPTIDSWDHSALDIDPFDWDTNMTDEPQGSEWPKWVWKDGTPGVGEGVLCNTPAEEAAVLGLNEEMTKEELQAQADALGVTYDKRWGIERLRTAILEAETP